MSYRFAMNVASPLARVSCVLLMSVMIGCAAPSKFQVADKEFGKVTTAGALAIVPGTTVTLIGSKFLSGQRVNMFREGRPLLSNPIIVDEDGKFKTTIDIPENAVIGLHNVLVSAEGPPSSLIFPIKVSQKPVINSGELSTIKSKRIGRGLYQASFSQKNDWLFVTSSWKDSGTSNSQLFKLDPRSLETIQSTTPAANSLSKSVFGVYGIGLDDTRGTIWVTNTKDDTVAVYRQSDLTLIRQFEPGLVKHSRDVVVDEKQGKVFVSSFGVPFISVFDAASLNFLKNIYIGSQDGNEGKAFSPMGMSFDMKRQEVVVASLRTNEIAIINTKSLEVTEVKSLDGVQGAIAVATLSEPRIAIAVGQTSDSASFIPLGKTSSTHFIQLDGGPISAVVDQQFEKIFIANRTGGTLTQLSSKGEVLANIPVGSLPNHVTLSGTGTAYIVSKARGQDDENGDIITAIKYR